MRSKLSHLDVVLFWKNQWKGDMNFLIPSVCIKRGKACHFSLSALIATIITNLDDSMDLCIFCTFPVRARQEGLQCDDCQQWQHRMCQTGISQQEYRVAVQTGQPIDWRCAPCSDNPLESTCTRLEDDLNSTVFDPPEFDPPASPVDFNVDIPIP